MTAADLKPPNRADVYNRQADDVNGLRIYVSRYITRGSETTYASFVAAESVLAFAQKAH